MHGKNTFLLVTVYNFEGEGINTSLCKCEDVTDIQHGKKCWSDHMVRELVVTFL